MQPELVKDHRLCLKSGPNSIEVAKGKVLHRSSEILVVPPSCVALTPRAEDVAAPCVGSTESARRRAGAGAGAELLPRERGAVLGAAPPPGPAGQGGPRPCRAGRSAGPFPGRAVLRVHSHRVQRGDGCENASAWTGRPPVRHGCDSSCLAGSPGCPGGGPGPARRPQARRHGLGPVSSLQDHASVAFAPCPRVSAVCIAGFVWRLRRFPFSVAAWAPSPQPQPSPLGPWGARCRRGGRASCPPALAGVDSTSSRSRGHFPSVPWKRG